ncbi:NEDD4-binding protein 1 [Denticeps clupeoides]|uniref:NEDD4-binding protein 1 n=1 Tax=Denticeps clupeoides TaxID=299321 RepID=A0AAY4DLT6_9TELE|nr:NEDD4-binding protein 1 [Denticeps clupeoides]
MSTTRPLLAAKRTDPAASTRAEAAAPAVDEFTVPEDKQAELKCARARVEQVFQVAFTIIGLLDHSGAHSSKAARQIWLQLRGERESVSRAKEYVKGLCDPELQEEERYPVDMHCIFAGARGLFLDRLLRDTSAEVVVLEPGRLRLLGRAEAVVMAQSRVQQFVALFHEKRSLPGDREPAVKRAFKTFVEERADKYAMELLLLPSALKEELLGLVQSPSQAAVVIDLEQDRSQTSTPVTELSNRILGATFEDKTGGCDVAPLNCRPSKRRSSDSEPRDTKRQFSLERREDEQEKEKEVPRPREASQTRAKTSTGGTITTVVLDPGEFVSDDAEAVSPETNLRCLVNFFRTMGYQQDVVERVVRDMGQTEDTFLLLERIVEESQRGGAQTPRTPDSSSSSSSSSTCTLTTKTRDRERLQCRTMTDFKAKENIRPPGSNCLGLKEYVRGGLGGVTLKKSSAQSSVYEVINIDDDDDMEALSGPKARTIEKFDFSPEPRVDYVSRGGSQTLVPMRMETVTALGNSPHSPPRTSETRPGCSYQRVGTRAQNQPRADPPAPPKSTPLTGVSRFQQSLRTPYRLVLQNEPGCPDLRHIIIDGSNMAMAHGNHKIFSCRGIAIAVEAFWRRGHREITVFVPQWRQKRDPSITEQHFLSQLEDLRLLSFTPSREVCGQRISSHDDRFFLHLAEKTGGVIVTNDNLRDFVHTSESWRRIIQERLLPFTFVDDHFMIPDDPLGKHGPHLDLFLRKDNRPRPATPPLRTDHRAPTPVFVPRQSFATQARPASHWPHSGPPGWHPPCPSPSPPPQRSPLETSELKKQLYDIFPDQKQLIDRILSDNPYMRDLNALSGLLLG